MGHFQRTTFIDASIEHTWQFHERPDVLQLLTPPWQPVTVLHRDRGLAIGARSEFRLWIGPLAIEWLAVHTACEVGDRDRHFIDTQARGPFDSWQHHHQFDAIGPRYTRLTDTIDWVLPGGAIVNRLAIPWLDGELDRLFRHRHAVTQRHCAMGRP